MTMEDSSSIFIDTNILIYANVPDSPFHEAAVAKVRNLQLSGIEICISRQVIREYLVTMTRPGNFIENVDQEVVISELQKFEESFTIFDEKADVTKCLLGLLKSYPIAGKQVHDANIVATMLTHNISTLLTHNEKDFKRFADRITLVGLAD